MKKNLLRSFFVDASDGYEDRTKFVQSRVQMVQKHVPAINSALADYVNKTAALMDSGDKVAATLANYANAENVSIGTKTQLLEFANILYDVGGKRNSQIKLMEANVLQELSEYGKRCKNVLSEVKCSAMATDKERVRLKQLRRAQEDHVDDPRQISLAEAELIKARSESSRSTKSLMEHIDIFERRKLNDLREALLAWATAELRFHAKALELLTDAYNVAAKIDVEADVEEFRNRLRAENSPRLDSSRDTSFQRSDSLIQLLSMPFNRSGERLTGIGIPHPSPSGIPSTVSSFLAASPDCNTCTNDFS